MKLDGELWQGNKKILDLNFERIEEGLYHLLSCKTLAGYELSAYNALRKIKINKPCYIKSKNLMLIGKAVAVAFYSEHHHDGEHVVIFKGRPLDGVERAQLRLK